MKVIITVGYRSDKTGLPKTTKIATILAMTNEERDLTTETESIAETPAWSAVDSPEIQAEELLADAEPTVIVADESLPVNVTDGLDLEAALAAVSTLSDVVAEQEAEEQARIAEVEAEVEAQVEAQARVEHPERFFPVPPLATLKRGQLASIVPAFVLIGIGIWLTYSTTVLRALPDTGLLVAVSAAGLSLTLLARWLSSGRWARGSLFFALSLLLAGGVTAYLIMQPTPLGVGKGWPLMLAAVGLSTTLSAVLAQPFDRRLLLPGLILIVAGLAGMVITLGLIDSSLVTTVAALWPAVVVVMAVLWLGPLIFRRR